MLQGLVCCASFDCLRAGPSGSIYNISLKRFCLPFSRRCHPAAAVVVIILHDADYESFHQSSRNISAQGLEILHPRKVTQKVKVTDRKILQETKVTVKVTKKEEVKVKRAWQEVEI